MSPIKSISRIAIRLSDTDPERPPDVRSALAWSAYWLLLCVGTFYVFISFVQAGAPMRAVLWGLVLAFSSITLLLNVRRFVYTSWSDGYLSGVTKTIDYLSSDEDNDKEDDSHEGA